MSKDNPWKKQKSRKIFENPWIRLDEDEVINPGGGISMYGKIHFKNYAIAIIPLDENENTWLVGQWRYATDEYSWELPMGGGPEGTDKLESAKRELKEETGLSAGKWTELMKIHLSNSVTDEEGYCFVAEDLEEGEPEPEETEDLTIKKVPFSVAYEMALDGRITDGFSVAAILKMGRQLGL